MAEVSWLSEYKSAAAGATPAAYGPDVLGAAGGFDAGFPVLEGEEQGWQERALCAETDPEAFFPEKGGSTREAKKICTRSEEHTSELQSRQYLVCRLLLEKKTSTTSIQTESAVNELSTLCHRCQ